MATMNVSMPDAMKDWVDGLMEKGRYASVSDYVRDLIRKDQERTDKIVAIQRLIDEGLASGISDKSVEDIFAEAIARAKGN